MSLLHTGAAPVTKFLFITGRTDTPLTGIPVISRRAGKRKSILRSFRTHKNHAPFSVIYCFSVISIVIHLVFQCSMIGECLSSLKVPSFLQNSIQMRKSSQPFILSVITKKRVPKTPILCVFSTPLTSYMFSYFPPKYNNF